MFIWLLLLSAYIWHPHLQQHETTLEKITSKQFFHTILIVKLRNFIFILWKRRPFNIRKYHCIASEKKVCNILPTRNWYIYWVNIRIYYCLTWQKIIYITCKYLPETDTFIGMRMFATMQYREFPYVQGDPH